MSHRSRISCFLTAALVAGLSASPAIAANYPPTPETPVINIPKDFKPTAPVLIFTTTFNVTHEVLKVGQPTHPAVAGFAKNALVTEFIRLPSGLKVELPKLKTDKNGHVLLKELYFKTKGTYTIFVKVGNKTKQIKIIVK
jgi:hypothetical protein